MYILKEEGEKVWLSQIQINSYQQVLHHTRRAHKHISEGQTAIFWSVARDKHVG